MCNNHKKGILPKCNGPRGVEMVECSGPHLTLTANYLNAETVERNHRGKSQFSRQNVRREGKQCTEVSLFVGLQVHQAESDIVEMVTGKGHTRRHNKDEHLPHMCKTRIGIYWRSRA
jgi:hypothetical protein